MVFWVSGVQVRGGEGGIIKLEDMGTLGSVNSAVPAFLMIDTCENLDILALIKIVHLICISENTLFFNIFNRWLEENEFYVTIWQHLNFFFKLLFIF